MTNLAPAAVDFSFESKYIDVLGSKMHYIEQGEGEPILFLQGMLFSNHVWRNIIPALSPYGRCIALDLIGTGKSDKPDIEYRVFDHIRYVEEFINVMGLKRITLVMHFWGSVIGFDYAIRNPQNIKALAFIEAVLRPLISVKSLSLPGRELIRLVQGSDQGYKAIVEDNYLLTKVLPMVVLRKLSEEELAIYRQPFAKPEQRKVLWQWAQDLPFPKVAKDVKELIHNYSEQLQKSFHPKLLLYSMPGFFTTMDMVMWAHDHLPNLEIADLGEALHCPQETNPASVREALAKWYKGI